jgi:class 3 adenylate cyclase
VVEQPETRYAKTADGVHIAYQVVGEGPSDLVFVPGFVFNVEHLWTGWPQAAAFVSRLASFSRLILFDRRGTGLSDHILPGEHQLTLEARMDDIRAVMDAAGSERAVLLGFESGVAVCAVFAATYPERTSAFLGQSPEGGRWAPELAWRWTDEDWDEYLGSVERGWGTLAFATREGQVVWPEIGDDPVWWRDYATWMRRSVSPGDALALLRIDSATDAGGVLPVIRVPTLVIHRTDDKSESVEEARYVAAKVPGAQLVELPGSNHGWVSPDQDEVLDEIERFVRHLRAEEAELDRTLATVLFTDIVGSTEKAAALGDRGWRDLIERHHATVRGSLARYRGKEVDTAGDGFFATFDGPARAVRCAQAIIGALKVHDLQIRAGVHTGEVETIDQRVGGLAVVIGARIGALAGESEILASSTVKDLTAGSGLSFEERGEHELKGVPERWRLYRVISG